MTGRHGPRGPDVVALGGGHGLATTLRAARRYAATVTAVVSVADDGGSSGRLRATTGMPAPGDLRRCLVALADPASLWARAFEHRFAGGDLDGHALGNLVIAGLAEVTGDFGSALDAAAEVLGVTGRVLPATSVPVTLKGEAAGSEVLGQVNVQSTEEPITAVSVVPPDAASPAEALAALATADQVVIGPGSLYTSLLATCVVRDVRATLAARHGGRVYVCNLRPQVPETAGYGPADHVRALIDHGVAVDTVLVDAASLLDAASVDPASPVEPGRPPALVAADGGRERRRLAEVAAAAGIGVVVADLRPPGRHDHDPVALGAALAALASGSGL